MLWGLQNVSSLAAGAKKMATVAGEVSKASEALQTRNPAANPQNAEARRPVPLTSKAGGWYVGYQLDSFDKETDGSLSIAKAGWINLYYTEGRTFKLTGKVLLANEAKGDPPYGFALYLREFDSLHRYEWTCRGMQIRCRRHEGTMTETLSFPIKVESNLSESWHGFSVAVSEESIVATFGNQTEVVKGPLDIDGANKIMLCPGAKLKDLIITLLD